ncbi:unnamed protein product [Effrenium voratum]|nr:unnamed protein product [Effrenium voratum]
MSGFLAWLGHEEPQDSPFIKALKDDWLAQNSESREEDVTRKQLEARIAAAEKAAGKITEPNKLLDLAEAYGVLNPRDKRCLETCELVMRFSLPFLDRQRQGDAHQLHARSLFLHNDPEAALRALLRAQECYKDQGTKALRRSSNAALLRTYAALQQGDKACERLQVALTMCETKEDALNVYLSGKVALEGAGCDNRFESIWDDYLDDNPETKESPVNLPVTVLFPKAHLEGQMKVMKDLSKQVGPKDAEDDFKMPETLPEAIQLAKQHKVITCVLVIALLVYLAFAIYASLWISRRVVARLKKD